MEPQKNLCAMIPLSLHSKVREEQERSGQSLSVYMAQLLTNYYEKGEKSMDFTKTLAFQVSEELYNLIKDHLEREKQRTGKEAQSEGLRHRPHRAGAGGSRAAGGCAAGGGGPC